MGNFGLQAQLNTKRFSQRRKPDESTQVVMPFNEAKFNFTKIKENEILFTMKNMDTNNSGESHKVIINVSPIEYGHILLVPNIDMKLPQVLDKEAVKLAAQVCLLSKHRGFCMGFNSLCALASVNHQHLHALYINYQLPIDKVILQPREGGLLILENYIVRGYAIQLEKNVEFFANQVSLVTNHLCLNNVAHNLFIRRERCASEEAITSNNGSALTAFIFPKLPSAGIKGTLHLNSNCFDLAGYLLFKDQEEYDGITEHKAVEILNQYTYREDEFDRLTDELTYLLKRMVPTA